MKPLEVMEVYPAYQGEGIRIGSPCVFVRFARCNLKCSWCDTKYTWDPRLLPNEHVDYLTPKELADRILDLKHGEDVVFTGGEPMLQDPTALHELWSVHLRHKHITVETAGTIQYKDDVDDVDLWSFSPKLHSSGNFKTDTQKYKYW